MIKFTYHQDYDKSSYNELKRKTEGTIKKYVLDNFKEYKDLDIEIQLLPTSLFIDKYLASVSIIERKIKFNFDNFCNYLIRLKKHRGKLLMPDIRKEHNFIFNALHHEIQHIINHIEHADTFKYIASMDSCGYVKLGIANILDEYLASYATQKQVFHESGTADGGLAWFCGKKREILESKKQNERISFYVQICDLLAYAIAECKVIKEKKDIEAFDSILCDENVIDFKDAFTNIKKIVENYKIEKYKEYAKACEEQIMKILDVLRIDLEYLRAVDNVGK